MDFELRGARNLLVNCLDVQPNSKLLLVCEDPGLGWYDEDAAKRVAGLARDMCAQVSTIRVGDPDSELPTAYAQLLNANDTIIYFARVGDQDRFHDSLPDKNIVMIYARDDASLSSQYGSTHHGAMKDLKAAIDLVTLSAKHIAITCPLGTQLTCHVSAEEHRSGSEVTIKRFPLCVPQPVLANETSGTVALTRWLTPTGSRSYTPANCRLEDVVFAIVERGRIIGLEGRRQCVDSIQNHYRLVSDKFGIDKDVVHSWHAGIHPGCSYNGNADDDPDRWSNNIFGNPRFLHFHTCGDYPPGEICWMVLDPTIEIDGVPLWENGKLNVRNFGTTSKVLEKWPEVKTLIDTPSQEIGISTGD
ncbi:MAG: hypothetical protein ACR2PF_07970 [Rhizobiaceae bacterium]